jgi:hypothetical protein
VYEPRKKLYLNVVVLSSDADKVDPDVSKSVNETSINFWKEKKNVVIAAVVALSPDRT